MTEIIEEADAEYSIPYLLYVFVLGTALVVAFTILGYSGANIFYSVFVGALFQSIYRLIKRIWQRKLTGTVVGGDDEEIEKNSFLTFALIYLAMCVVTLMWYGLGFGLSKLIN